MSAVVSGVLAKLELLLPGQIGDNRRWSTSLVQELTMAADARICDQCVMKWLSQTIPLVAGQDTYDLDSDFIKVISVEFAYDGVNYDNFLMAATLKDLDDLYPIWRVSPSGTRPDYYTQLGAPGIPDLTGSTGNASKISIYRQLPTVTAETIRVNGYALGAVNRDVPDDVQAAVHVNYVMAMLRAKESVEMASTYYQAFLNGVRSVKSRFVGKYAENINL